ncbi:AAA family ATPase [Candidatus Marithioploca araucensis]|uniref:AAA family ATPase n=1 Tax=Candidatus Marithioploca araucensis TaxID=70273 RepID=A0ABT7VS88_9GAMM|nr:AAA family ATPase [Candidatus Marithioploca araucensis]
MSSSFAKVQSLSLKQFTAFSEAKFDFSPGINIFIGENATGKSHLMKIIYTLLKGCEMVHQRQILSDDERFKEVFDSELHNVFQISNYNELVRLNSKVTEIYLDYANTHFRVQMGKDGFSIQNEPKSLPNPSSLLYLPGHEFLSINEGFIAAYNKRELPYDATYYDLSLALNALPLRQHQLAEVQNAIELLQNAMVGENWNKPEIVKQENGRFYFDLPEGYLNVHCVADGYRKIGTLLYLLKNGSLTKNSILFWDEPEANLNPKLTIKIAKVLPILAKMGMQIFMTTHDFLFAYELSLLAEYPPKNRVDLKFFSLYKPSSQSELIVESGPTLAHIDHNAILDEFTEQHDREGTLFYHGRG